MASAAKLAYPLEHLQEHVLGQFFGIGAIAAYSVNRVKNPVLVLCHQQAESFHVAFLAPGDQDVVVKGHFSFGVSAWAGTITD